MATWEITTEWKKSSVERQFWYNGDKVIIREEGYRWGTFTVESDTMPLTYEELKNEDGYELGCIENDNCWELVDLTDGCWSEIEKGRNCTDEDLQAFEEAWEENYYEGVEALGWSQDDCEFYFTSGSLKLTNLDTGKEYSGSVDPATLVHTIELPEPKLTKKELAKLANESHREVLDLQAQGLEWPWGPTPANTKETAKWPFATEPLVKEEPELTDWFPVEINPVRKGFYEIQTLESINFPHPNKAKWDGKKFTFLDHTVTHWRGLAKDPGAK
jgi:hypothetical protein